MTTATKEKPKAKEKEKEPRVKTAGGHPYTARISFGTDKEGQKYGPKNNPKREGSATHGRFQLYKHNMTVEQAVAAGITAGDLSWDAKQGYIIVS